MPRAPLFGDILVKARRERGFPTAHAFYRNCEGRRTFRLSFRNYLNLEKGLSLPQASRLEALLLALGLTEQSPLGRELVRAYLSALGLDALLRYLTAAEPTAPHLPSLKLEEMALRTALQHNAFQLTTEQWRAIVASTANYACYLLILTTPEWWPTALVARKTGLTVPVTRRALRALAAVGLFKLQGDRVRSVPGPDKQIQPPPPQPATMPIRAALQRRFKEFIEANGTMVFRKSLKFRTPKRSLDQYLPHLDDAVSLAAVFEDLESRDGTLYVAESRVWSMFGEDAGSA